MAEIRLPRESRLRYSDLLLADDILFWDVNDLPDYVARNDEISHLVQGGDRIDLLAYKYYGSSGLWWVIAWANDMESIPGDLNEGTKIRIPSPAYVNSTLLP